MDPTVLNKKMVDENKCNMSMGPRKNLAPVVRKVDNAIHRINHNPGDSVVCFVNTYLLDRDLSGG